MRLLRACFWAVGSRGALLGLAGSQGSLPDGSSLLVLAGGGWGKEGKEARLGAEPHRGRPRFYFRTFTFISVKLLPLLFFAHAHCDVLLMCAASNVGGGCGRCNILFDIYCIGERPIVLQFGGQHIADYQAMMRCRDAHEANTLACALLNVTSCLRTL